MISLGIESSCDETSVAIINNKNMLSNVINSQINTHKHYGGVVPEVASREHLKNIIPVLTEALKIANISLNDVDIICSTTGPGMFGPLMIGSLSGKMLAYLHNKPFIAVNHLVAHALMPGFFQVIKYPALLLLISGGHTQFVAILNENTFKIIGSTVDDSVGEAFDKSARLLGLGYPGGQQIENLAKKGDADKFKFTQPFYKKPHCDLSFSGLKTSIRKCITSIEDITPKIKYDLCASIQKTIVNTLAERTNSAIKIMQQQYNISSLIVAGGVAANKSVGRALTNIANKNNIPIYIPPANLCTDNALMVAWAGAIKYKHQGESNLAYKIDPRWKIDNNIF